jgi:hypothetical protein
VRVMVLEMVTLVGNQCLVLWLKKYHHLKIKWKFNCYLVVAIYRPFGLSINYHTILSQYYNHTVSALVCKQDIITVRISDHVYPAPYIMIHFFPVTFFTFCCRFNLKYISNIATRIRFLLGQSRGFF